jgi:hypothetical protein
MMETLYSTEHVTGQLTSSDHPVDGHFGKLQAPGELGHSVELRGKLIRHKRRGKSPRGT